MDDCRKPHVTAFCLGEISIRCFTADSCPWACWVTCNKYLRDGHNFCHSIEIKAENTQDPPQGNRLCSI